jgi:hypothetical protein
MSSFASVGWRLIMRNHLVLSQIDDNEFEIRMSITFYGNASLYINDQQFEYSYVPPPPPAKRLQ